MIAGVEREAAGEAVSSPDSQYYRSLVTPQTDLLILPANRLLLHLQPMADPIITITCYGVNPVDTLDQPPVQNSESSAIPETEIAQTKIECDIELILVEALRNHPIMNPDTRVKAEYRSPDRSHDQE